MGFLAHMRPAELYFFTSRSRREFWADRKVTRSALIHLTLKGYLRVERDNETDLKHFRALRKNISDLRPWEKFVYQYIQDRIHENIDTYNDWNYFQDWAVENKFLEPYERRAKLFGINLWFNVTDHHETPKYEKLIKEIVTLETSIEKATKSSKPSQFHVLMSYAYPSTGWAGIFEQKDPKLAEIVKLANETIDIARTSYDDDDYHDYYPY